ncbi:MAG: glycosyltransferase family 4 protein [Planctomycetota bacterium]
MRVTLVVHQFPPNYFTGTESYAHAVGRELLARGHDVDVFSLEPRFSEADGPWGESREIVDGLPVRRIHFWMMLGRDWRRMEYRHPMMAETFAEHLRERQPDVVHSFHLRHVGADLIDRCIEQRRRVVLQLMDFWFLCPRVILMKSDGSACDGPPDGGRGCVPCHAPDLEEQLAASPIGEEALATARASCGAGGDSQPSWELTGKLSSLLERPDYLMQRLRQTDAVVAPTRFLRDVFIQNGAPAELLQHCSYGVDTKALANNVATLRAARDHAEPRPLTFGFFGTYSPHKGPDVLIEAFTQVQSERVRCVLRGRATDFPEFSGPLQKRAAQDPRIDMRGPFAREELAEALSEIDVLIVPSTWHENAPFVVLEARAAGLPVFASRFGGLVEVVDDNVDGELFAPGCADDLATRLQRLVDEPDRLQRYRAAVQPPKTLHKAVDEFEALYAEGGPGPVDCLP